MEYALSGVAALCLGYVACELAGIRLHHAAQSRRLASLAQAYAEQETSRGRGPAAATRAELARSGLIGHLELPRLGVAGVVEEGVERATLRRAIGHLPGSVLPGEPGNVVVAAHRDTHFSGLERVEPGDLVRVATLDGTFEYRVTATSVVEPWRTDVLAAGPGEQLTLITCYPFTIVGPAPRRFVVRADRTARSASEPGAPAPAPR